MTRSLANPALEHGYADPAMARLEAPPTPAPTVPVGQLRTLRSGQRVFRALAVVLPPVLALYALFDRAFAYIHVPGVPLYIGEMVMLVCVAALLLATGYMHRGVRHSPVAKVLLVFAAWGAVGTIPNIGKYGIFAIRDAALWYYALLAIPVCVLVIMDPGLVRRWADFYRRFIPWMLLYSPFPLFVGTLGGALATLMVPGSATSVWDHRPGNIAVHATIAIAFLWLVPGQRDRFRVLLTGLAVVILLLTATQNRGSFIAAMVGLTCVWIFTRRRARISLAVLATVLIVVAAAWGLNIHVNRVNGRSVSVNQLIENLNSLAAGSSSGQSGNLGSTVEFREHLWSAVINKVKTEDRVMNGLGFGPNIAKEVGFGGGEGIQLRSPHNSHVDIFARGGAIGLAIWLALWAT